MSNRTTLTGSFAAFGAKLVNRYWACSAIADDGALVFSLGVCSLNHLPGSSPLQRRSETLDEKPTRVSTRARPFDPRVQDETSRSPSDCFFQKS